MEITVGAILTGKVSGITKFGAFVALPEGKSGMVHISEIANTFVSDIHDHLQENQEITVKVIGIESDGKIKLSIRKALPQEPRSPRRPQAGFVPRPAPKNPEDMTFEDKLKQFMSLSESKMSDLNRSADRKRKR